MRLSVNTFRGEAPRISPRSLPEGMAQQAINCRLLSGDLESWRNFGTEIALSKTAPIVTIYKLGDFWLEWTQSELDAGAVEIDVAKSTVGGDETNRVYLTGLDRPRYTNLPLAVQSAGPPFPVQTRLLGVIAPETAPTVVSSTSEQTAITLSDDMSNGSLWSFSGLVNTGITIRNAYQKATDGNPAGCIEIITQESSTNAYAFRDAAIQRARTLSFRSQVRIAQTVATGTANMSWRFYNSSGGIGPVVVIRRLSAGTGDITIGQADNWTSLFGTIISTSGTGIIPALVWLRMQIDVTLDPSGDAAITATLSSEDGLTAYATLTATAAARGGFVGFAANCDLPAANGGQIVRFDNLQINATNITPDTSDDRATSYVYTFVNDIGEESAPSPASITVIKDVLTTVTITTPTAPPTGLDWRIETKRIYRSVTTLSVTTFFFVAEVALTEPTYIDILTDEQLGEALVSDDWDIPPENLRGILALPNDVYVGFVVNQICFSVQGRPHAWPVRFRLNTDFPIVAIGNVDTTVIAATQKFPYLATGNAPDAYSMTKLELPQSCVSKRGCVYLRAWGWCYPSPDGYVAVAGTGQARIISEQLFSRKEWQALNPSTLIAREHDDRLFAFYTKTDATREGLMIEAKEQGFGKVTLAFHATALYADPITDLLYLVLDVNNPPTTQGTPSTNQISPDGETVYIWDAYAGGSPTLTPLLPYYWKGKINQLKVETCFKAVVVTALDYDDCTAIFFADGASYHTEQVVNGREFLLPPTDAIDFEVALSGTSRVNSIQVAEDVDELRV